MIDSVYLLQIKILRILQHPNMDDPNWIKWKEKKRIRQILKKEIIELNIEIIERNRTEEILQYENGKQENSKLEVEKKKERLIKGIWVLRKSNEWIVWIEI